MKRWRLSVGALVLSSALLIGCNSSSGTNFNALAQAFTDCSQESMASLVNVLYALASVPDYIASEGSQSYYGFDVSVSETSPTEWDFAVIFDTNGNGIPDTTVSGTAIFSNDPVSLAAGDTVHFTFQIQNSVIAGGPVDMGTLTGSGDVLVTLGVVDGDVSVTGTVHVSDGTCSADLTFTVANPLNIRFADIPVVVADLFNFEIFGEIQAHLETMSHSFDGTLTATDGDLNVAVEGMIDEKTNVSADFDMLPTDTDVQNGLVGGIDLGFNTIDLLDSIMDSFAASLAGTNGVTLTPTADPDVFNYSVDLPTFTSGNFDSGTVTGVVTRTYAAPPAQLAGIVLQLEDLSATWTITNAHFSNGTLTGQNSPGRPFHYHFFLGSVVADSGAGSFALDVPVLTGFSPLSLAGTFDIPDEDPAYFDGSGGRIIVDADVGGSHINDVWIVDDDEDLVTIDGIPIPYFYTWID